MQKTSDLTIQSGNIVIEPFAYQASTGIKPWMMEKSDSVFNYPGQLNATKQLSPAEAMSRARNIVNKNQRVCNTTQMFASIGSTMASSKRAKHKVGYSTTVQPTVQDNVITGYKLAISHASQQEATNSEPAPTETVYNISNLNNTIKIEAAEHSANNQNVIIIDPQQRCNVLTDLTQAKTGDIVLLLTDEIYNHLPLIAPKDQENTEGQPAKLDKDALTQALQTRFLTNYTPTAMDIIRALNEIALANVLQQRFAKLKPIVTQHKTTGDDFFKAHYRSKYNKASKTVIAEPVKFFQSVVDLFTKIEQSLQKNKSEDNSANSTALATSTLKDFLKDCTDPKWAKQHQIDMTASETCNIIEFIKNLTSPEHIYFHAKPGYVTRNVDSEKLDWSLNLVKTELELYLSAMQLQSGGDSAICAAIIPDANVELIRAWLEHPTQRPALLKRMQQANLTEEVFKAACEKLAYENCYFINDNWHDHVLADAEKQGSASKFIPFQMQGNTPAGRSQSFGSTAQLYSPKIINFLQKTLLPQIHNKETTQTTPTVNDTQANYYQHADEKIKVIEQLRANILLKKAAINRLGRLPYLDGSGWQTHCFTQEKLQDIHRKRNRAKYTSVYRETRDAGFKNDNEIGLILAEIDQDVLMCTSIDELHEISKKLTKEFNVIEDCYQSVKAAGELINYIKKDYVDEITATWKNPAAKTHCYDLSRLAAEIHLAKAMKNPILDELVKTIRLELNNVNKSNASTECQLHIKTIENARNLLANPTSKRELVKCNYHLEQLAKTKRPSWYVFAETILLVTLVLVAGVLLGFSLASIDLNIHFQAKTYIHLASEASILAGCSSLLYFTCKKSEAGSTKAFRTLAKGPQTETTVKDDTVQQVQGKTLQTGNSSQNNTADTQREVRAPIAAVTKKLGLKT